MEVFYSLDEFEKTGYQTSLALGFFDGVHLGHRQVIESARRDKGACRCAVLTFSSSPAVILRKTAPRLLTTNEQKCRILEEIGIDAVIFADFLSLKDMSAERFVKEVLHEKLRARKVFCGFNYRFGYRGDGDADSLIRLCRLYGIKAKSCPPVLYNSTSVSSSFIRDLLEKGEINQANTLLCHPFTITGDVRHGNHIGSALGFPTLNLPLSSDSVVPRFGVYASEVRISDLILRGATNIGVHPTVKEIAAPLCETFLLDYEGVELYGEKAECRLLRFIRPERKFFSLDELKAVVQQDIETISSSL